MMKNVEVRVEGNRLLIEVDLTQNLGPSASGKSTLIATTAGNKPVPGRHKTMMGLTVFEYRS
jgi:ABC-type uncharacterized transport system YnjBCD ATPase subunit